MPRYKKLDECASYENTDSTIKEKLAKVYRDCLYPDISLFESFGKDPWLRQDYNEIQGLNFENYNFCSDNENIPCSPDLSIIQLSRSSDSINEGCKESSHKKSPVKRSLFVDNLSDGQSKKHRKKTSSLQNNVINKRSTSCDKKLCSTPKKLNSSRKLNSQKMLCSRKKSQKKSSSYKKLNSTFEEDIGQLCFEKQEELLPTDIENNDLNLFPNDNSMSDILVNNENFQVKNKKRGRKRKVKLSSVLTPIKPNEIADSKHRRKNIATPSNDLKVIVKDKKISQKKKVKSISVSVQTELLLPITNIALNVPFKSEIDDSEDVLETNGLKCSLPNDSSMLSQDNVSTTGSEVITTSKKRGRKKKVMLSSISVQTESFLFVDPALSVSAAVNEVKSEQSFETNEASVSVPADNQLHDISVDASKIIVKNKNRGRKKKIDSSMNTSKNVPSLVKEKIIRKKGGLKKALTESSLKKKLKKQITRRKGGSEKALPKSSSKKLAKLTPQQTKLQKCKKQIRKKTKKVGENKTKIKSHLNKDSSNDNFQDTEFLKSFEMIFDFDALYKKRDQLRESNDENITENNKKKSLEDINENFNKTNEKCILKSAMKKPENKDYNSKVTPKKTVRFSF